MMLFEALWLLLLSACCILNSKASVEGDTETFYPRKLVRDVTEKLSYDYRIRPVRNYSKPINVSIRMNLYQIVDVNERSQHVSLYMWIEQKWRDEFLRWDPQEYEGLNSIIVPYDRVWLPDTYLYNSLEMVRENTERWISVVLTMEKDRNDSSLVSFRYPAIYRYTCNMDILFFPFDEQRCTMSFGSWLYDSAGIDYHPFTNNVIMNDFIPSEEWSVLAFTCKRHLFEYKCCKVPFSVLVCDLILHRKPLHYLVNLVVPTLIITLISFVGFFSPATTNGERTEKVNLGITTLLAMSILLLMVSDQMPTTSNFVPLIGWFYLSVILLISIATVLTALIIMLQKNGYYGHRVPDWLKKFFFVHVARILCMKTPVKLASMVKYAEAFKMENEMQRFKDHELRVPLASCDATPLSSDRNNYEKNMSTSTNDFVFERQMSSANKKFSNHYTNNHNDEQNLTNHPMILRIHIFSSLFFANLSLNSEESLQNHVRLLKNLLGNPNYDKRVLPVTNFQHAINITMDMQLFQIIEINEPAQYLQLYVSIVQTWHDELLSWDPSDFGGLDTIILPHDSIWIPDTYLYNILEMVREKAERWSSVNVKRIKTADNASYMPGCSVYFRYPAMYRFTCHMEIFYFPFDVQICNLTFGSLTYDSSAVVYFPMDVNVTITSFVENQEWTVVEFKMFREQVQQCCGQPISLIQARLTLKRKPLYYVINLIVPAFIVTIISFVGFFTPDNSYGERKDKVNLGISTLLAMSVLLMSLSDTMPTTSKYLPVMGMFYLCIIVLISLATLMASLVLKLDQKSRTGPIPHLFRTMFFKRLSSLVFANIPSYHQNKTRSKSSGDSSSAQRFGRLFTLNGLKGRWIFGRRRDSDGIDQLESRRPPASKILTQWCCELHDINLMILKENQKRESILASDGPWFVGVLERMMFALAVLSLLVVILILFCFS